MFIGTYTSSRMKRKSFYRKSELQMFLLIFGGHKLVHQNGAYSILRNEMKRNETKIVSIND